MKMQIMKEIEAKATSPNSPQPKAEPDQPRLAAFRTTSQDPPPSANGPCYNCGGPHMKANCPQPPKFVPKTKSKGGGKGKKGGGGGGSGGGGGGGGGGDAGARTQTPPGGRTPSRTPFTEDQKAQTKCAYFQVKWHKGETCHKSPCAFLHKLSDTKKE